jgi:hypothetical protein
MRPKPPNYHEVDYDGFKAEDYDVLILQDQNHLKLPLAKAEIPRVFIEHNPPNSPTATFPVTDQNITTVFVSERVRQLWLKAANARGLAIETGIPDEFTPWTGTEKLVITVVNHFMDRDQATGYTLWRVLTRGLPTKVIGDGNPTLGRPAQDYDDLRHEYSANRVYFSTTVAPGMALREALLTGMPVVTNIEDFPFENETEIFKSENLKILRDYLELCLKDYDAAKRVGAAGRKKALEHFNIDLFVERWEKLLHGVAVS